MILVLRRFRSNLTQALALAISVLLMTMILAGAPMYLNTIESLGLRSVLVTLSPSNRNLLVSVDNFPLTSRANSAGSERVDVTLNELGDLPVNVAQESHSRLHYWALQPDEIIPGRSSDSAVLQRFEGFPNHVEFVEGRAPVSTTSSASGVITGETAVPLERAQVLGVNVGDDIWLAATPIDPPYLKLRVVGRFTPNDLRDEFWFDLGYEATVPPAASLVARHPLPLFLSGDSLFDLLTGGPASIGTSKWLVQLDQDAINDQGPAEVERQIESTAGRLRSEFPEAKLLSALENRFKALREEIVFARIPVLMMGAVVLMLAVFLSVVSAGTFVSRMRVDTGRLRARGFSRRRIALTRLFETAPLVLVPALFAPLVAYAVISAFDVIPEYEVASYGLGVPVRIVWQAYAAALAGGVLLLGYMQLITYSANAREIDSERLTSEHVEEMPFFQRHYLDLVFLLFGGVVLWDLTTEESVVSDKAGELADVGQLLVFAPAIFVGLVIVASLRILPELAKLASAVFSRRGPVWVHLTVTMISRLRNTYAWPIAIVGIATGSIVLSATVSASLERSAADQAGYEVGADLRALPVDFNSGTRTAVLSSVRDIDGVTGASIGLRTIGGLRDGGYGAPFEFLAIEPAEFVNVGIFRDDYSELPLDELLLEMDGRNGSEEKLSPLRLLDNPPQIGIKMKASSSQEFVRASLRLVDAAGRSWSVDLGRVTSTDWEVRTGDVPASAVRPLDVVGIAFFEQANDELGTPFTVYIDDLQTGKTTVDEDVIVTSSSILETFDNFESWHPLASVKGIDTEVSEFEYERGRKVDTALRIDLGVGTNRGVRGVMYSNIDLVPVLLSTDALVGNGLSVGDQTVIHVFEQSVPVQIVGEIQYFPTMKSSEGGFVVGDAASLWTYLSMSSFNSAGFLEEMFIGLDDPSDQDVIANIADEIAGIHAMIDRSELQDYSLVTPLAIAGWRGAAIVTSVLAVVLGLLGLLTFGPIRPSGDRYKVAVLGALGVQKRVLLLVGFAEMAIVVVVGVSTGLAAGIFMAKLAVSTTTQTVSSGQVVPPIQFSTEWGFLAALVAGFALVAIMLTVRDVLAIRRMNLASTTSSSI